MAQVVIGVNEYGSSGKQSKTSVYCTNLSAANFATQTAAAESLATAIEGVIVGNLQDVVYAHVVSTGDGLPASTPLAQRENKWLVSARETATGNSVTFTIPCADLTLVGADGETLDITAGPGLALKNAIEAFVLSNDLNAITVSSIKFRARTL